MNAETGEVVQRLDYDSFGRVLCDTSPGFQPFGFQGGLYDPDTGLVEFGCRCYDAETGRWISKDPILLDGGWNVYAFCTNDPINRTDPSGLCEKNKTKSFWNELSVKCDIPDGFWAEYANVFSHYAQGVVNVFTGGLFDPSAGIFYRGFAARVCTTTRVRWRPTPDSSPPRFARLRPRRFSVRGNAPSSIPCQPRLRLQCACLRCGSALGRPQSGMSARRRFSPLRPHLRLPTSSRSAARRTLPGILGASTASSSSLRLPHCACCLANPLRPMRQKSLSSQTRARTLF